MKNQRNALMAGIAALALVAGAGLASAQDQPQDTKGAPHQMNQAPSGGKMDKSAQDQDSNAGAHTQQNMQGKTGANAGGKDNMAETQRSSQKDKTRTEQRNTGMTARHEGMKTRTSAQRRDHVDAKDTMAQGERKGFEGLQGNASGMHVQLNDEQRTQIRTTVINARNAPRMDKANFDVTVGTVIPRIGVRIVPVPTTLTQIEPAWRGYRYFVWMDQVVIVNPRDMTIIAVVRV